MPKIVFLTLLALGLPLLAAAAPTPAPSPTPAPARRLQAVRLRPGADSLRVIFLFDQPVPYIIKEDFARQRATVEFMNASVSSLPAELSRLKDPRLSGVWLKQYDAGLLTLELRFPASAVRIEHFAMDDPAAVVVDIYRTDSQAVNITDVAPEVTLKPDPTIPALTPAPRTPDSQPPAPVGLNALRVGSYGAVLPQLPPPGAAKTPAPVKANPKAVATPAVKSLAPVNPANPVSLTQGAPLTHGEAEPLDADYEFFPLSSLRVSSPLATEIRDDFLARNWATVLQKGLQYLEKNRISRETSPVLYFIAEAKWKLASTQPRPALLDALNMYQQALRIDSHGDLGAFGAYRMSQGAMQMDDFNTALGWLGRAASSTQPLVRQRALLMRIEALDQLRLFEPALSAIAVAAAQTSSTAQRVSLYVREADVRTAKEDYPGAWQAYQKATELDPKWLNMNFESGKSLARTAMETGHLAEARDTVIRINNYVSGGEQIRMLMLYVEILARMGNFKGAEEVYFTMREGLLLKPEGSLLLRKVLQMYPKDMLDGQGRYCMLLLQDGKIRQAMSELNKAYEDAQHGGAATNRLNPALQMVLPCFMENAVRQGRPFDAISAWKAYRHVADDKKLRRRCLIPLSSALEKAGFPEDALKLVRELRQDSVTSGTAAGAAGMDLAMREARLEVGTSGFDRAIPLLEDLQDDPGNAQYITEINDLLAKAYVSAGRMLEAAQALQALADTPDCPPSRRGEALTQAGEIYLDKAMPAQSVEIGLKGLMREKQLAENQSKENPASTMEAASGNALRVMLAQAYQATGDLARQKIVLQDLMRRPGLTDFQKNQAEIMLSKNQRRSGQMAEVEQLYKSIGNRKTGDENWRRNAQAMQNILDWNRKHPNEAVDLK